MLRKKGEAITALTVAYVFFLFIAMNFGITRGNGVFEAQKQKIRDAHNAPITIDNSLTEGNHGYVVK